MDFSEVLLGLRQSIARNNISQQDLNIITKYPEARDTLRDAFGTLNVGRINRMLNKADISITENDAGQSQLEIVIHRGGFPRVLKLAFPLAQLQPSPDPTVGCACCGLNTCEITETEVHLGEQSLPPFDPSVERTAHGNALSDAIASGKVKVSREDVSIEEVLTKIEELERELETND